MFSDYICKAAANSEQLFVKALAQECKLLYNPIKNQEISVEVASMTVDESKKTTNDYIMWFNIFSKYPKKFISDYFM